VVEMPSSRQPVLEQQQQQQQPSNEKATKITTFDNKLAEMPHQTHKEEQEKEKLKQIIEELQSQNKHLREATTTQGQQLQQQQIAAAVAAFF
jgi:hypothetical protein